MTNYSNYGTFEITPLNAFPATIGASGSWVSGIMVTGFPSVVAAVTSSQAGALTVQRYADIAGTIPVGPTFTQALSANTAAWTGGTDYIPYRSFQVTVTNTGGSTANITGICILCAIV